MVSEVTCLIATVAHVIIRPQCFSIDRSVAGAHPWSRQGRALQVPRRELNLYRSIKWVGASLLCIASPDTAFAAEPPIALVISNSSYAFDLLNIPAALNDGDQFALRLMAAGFTQDRVIRIIDPTQGTLTKTLAQVRAAYAGASAFVVFYSGHGIRYGERARLIPKDFSFQDLISPVSYRSIEHQTVAVSDVLDVVGTGSAPALFVFDACQDDGTAKNAGVFARLQAIEATRAANGGLGKASPLDDDARGPFDNPFQPRPPPQSTENLWRDGVMAVYGSVRYKSQPGISYAVGGQAMSELTSVLLEFTEHFPDRGVGEVFPLVKAKVWDNTKGFKPPQYPLILDGLTFSATLSMFAHPPEREFASAQVRTELRAFAQNLASAQVQARRSGVTSMSLSPVKLRKLLPDSVLAQALPTARQFPASAVAPVLGSRATVTANLVVRLWGTSDVRTIGSGAGPRPIRVQSSSAKSVDLRDGRVEFSDRISADPGFRITSAQTIPLRAKNLLDYDTKREADKDGILSETKVWHQPSGSEGDFVADLIVTERRPIGSDRRQLLATAPLLADQIVLLPLSPAEIRALDALEIRGADGTMLAELSRGDRDVPVGPLRATLRDTPGGLILQLASP